MPTLTKKQIVFPLELFTLIQTKAQEFGISVEAYIEHLVIQDLRTKPKTELNPRAAKKAELKKWQAEFEAKLAKLPIRQATPAEERAIGRAKKNFIQGKYLTVEPGDKRNLSEILKEAEAKKLS